MSLAQRVAVVVVVLLAASCAKDHHHPAPPHPQAIHLAAEPAPTGDMPRLVLCIRQFESIAPPTAQPTMVRELSGEPIRVFDVTIPIGPKFTAITGYETTKVTIAGTAQEVMQHRFRLTLDYTESSSAAAAPGAPTDTHAVTSTVELTPGTECEMLGQVRENNLVHILCVSIKK